VVRMLGAVTAALATGILFTPLPNLVTRWLARAGPLEPAQAVVVLGAGGVAPDGTLSNASLQRTLKGLELFRRGLAPILVFSGSPARHDRPAEAEARAEFARRCGVPPASILVETRARTTREEAQRLAEVLLPRGLRRILLVVDAPGVPRTRGAFAKVGFEVLPVPVRDQGYLESAPEARLELSRRAAMEALGWLYYRAARYL